MMRRSLEVLQKYFGYSSFKHGQEKIIESILGSNDTVGIMPTGGGKSLCYQIAGILFPGVTLVISPLISLMKDQVDALSELGIPSTFINSSLKWEELEQQLELAAQGKFKLIYIAPERLASDKFINILKNLPVSLLAIDEAHCVSQWGHDFRPSYLSIAALIKHLKSRPIITAFTATATEQVKEDIIKQLRLNQPNVYVTGFDRENLFFSVVKGTDKMDFVLDYLKSNREKSGIIYVATRKEVDNIYNELCKRGFLVGKYHAGLIESERSSTQEAFAYDVVRVMVATNAFGMGIDKSNVRFVIHFNMPKNMESYYQEAGRSGRDGDPAECILLFGASDIHIQKFLIEQGNLTPERKASEYSKLQDMVDYCHTSKCLRRNILMYFGEKDVNETCGNCENCKDEREASDITVEVQKILSCIKRMGEQYGASLVANVLRGSDTKKVRQLQFEKLPTYGIMRGYTINEITGMINLLVAEEYLNITEGIYPVIKLADKAIPVIRGKEQVIRKIKKKIQETAPVDTELFDLLRKLRKTISEEHKVPPYVIFHDSALHEMCKSYPVDRASMMAINGVGESKFEKYGSQFIEIIMEFIIRRGIIPTGVNQKPLKSSRRSSLVPSCLTTYEMYIEGKSLSEIALLRNLALTTIESHIIQCGYEGKAIDWDKFFTPAEEELVLDAVNRLGAQALRPIKDALPDEISYLVIKAVICKSAS